MRTTKRPTPRVQRIWAEAEREAELRGHDYVGTEHLLKALAGDPQGVAGWMLLSLGIRDQLAVELDELLDSLAVGSPDDREL
jgi:ATP-dependent Clp protease ATP-binding subunit ClpA